MSKYRFLLWTEENIKNAGDDVFFLNIEERKDAESCEIGISVVDKNKNIIQGGTLIVFKQIPNALMRIVKHNCVNPIIPVLTDDNGEIILSSETEFEKFIMHIKNIKTNEILKYLAESMVKKNQEHSTSNNAKH